MNVRQRIALWFAWRKALKEIQPTLEKWLGRPLTRKEMKMKNWKTTALGFLGGITGASMVGWFDAAGKPNWLAIAFALIATARGYYSKDRDVTGVQ